MKFKIKSYTTTIALSLLLFACKNNQLVQSDYSYIDTVVVAPEEAPLYRAAEKRTTDIIHTKLNLSFNWDSAFVNGEAELTFKPYFYDLDTVKIDARGFEFLKVELKSKGETKALEYSYDSLVISIPLPKVMKRTDTATLIIQYIAMPDKLGLAGSSAIAGDKGLYFINHDNSDPNKPRQLWSQGETQANSAWFPTVDSPNEKFTTEIYLTIEEDYTSISNGMKMFSVSNSDGTKTEYWKMTQPHAAYLVMIAVGPFAEYKDNWKDMEVNYYLDSAYLPYAHDIFGLTPEMIEFYSDYLGVKYPWPKYDQVVVRDYVSGAMENTTATIHGEFLQQTKREMIDYDNQDIIAHELFHHWFGDLITCESWSNLTLNEGFATYGEVLWQEYKHGIDEADWQVEQDLKAYISESKYNQVDLIRFTYNDKEDMFDSHSYSKGGRVIHMLRQYVGEEAFRASLKLFLTKNAYKNVEIHDLRLAFEEVTGEDLNWFFNQWFLASGHPVLEVSWSYDATAKKMFIYTSQNQDPDRTPIHTLPVPIEINTMGKIENHKIRISHVKDTFEFPMNQQPNYLNFDPRNVLLCEQTITQSREQWISQYKNSARYADRKEALKNLYDTIAFTNLEVFKEALKDPFWAIRGYAIDYVGYFLAENEDVSIAQALIVIAKEDDNTSIRSAAIEVLMISSKDSSLLDLYKSGLKDSSYAVLTSSFAAICEIDSTLGKKYALELEKEAQLDIVLAIADLYAGFGDSKDIEFFKKKSSEISGYGQYSFVQSYGEYLATQSDEVLIEVLPFFENISIRGNAWWVRLSGMLVIMTNHNRLFTEMGLLNGTLSEMEESNPNYSPLKTSLDEKKDTFEKLDKLWQEIGEKEINPRLVAIIQEYNLNLTTN